MYLLHLLRELVDGSRRVSALREQRDDGRALVGLCLDQLQVERPRVNVLLAQHLDDVLVHEEQRSVLAHAAHEQQLVEGAAPLLEVRDAHLHKYVGR